MTRKVGSNSQQTKQQLLHVASMEFATKGFQQASLREICKKANVTTGALYCFFKNKDAIFHAIILKTKEMILQQIQMHHLHSNDFLTKSDDENHIQDTNTLEHLLTLYRKEKVVFDVILNNRNHPEVIALHDDLINTCSKQYKEVLTAYQKDIEIDDFALTFFTKMEIETIITCIQNDFSDEEIRYHGKSLITMLENAFKSFIK